MNVETYHNACNCIAALIKGSEWEGHVYAVGGCCRDEVMGRDINDIDLAVNVSNGGVRLAEWLHEKGLTLRPPTYFMRYGTAMLHLAALPDLEIELVQTCQGSYRDPSSSDSPARVFGTVEHDALRRDFTINALFRNITTGETLDPTGLGIADIQARIIRTPRPPRLTIDDDPVRILRAVRLACALGWDISADLLNAMRDRVGALKLIKPERSHAELDKMLAGPDPVRAVRTLRRINAFRILIPRLNAAFSIPVPDTGFSLWDLSLRMLGALSYNSSPHVRMAALLHALALSHPAAASETPQEQALRSARIAEGILRKLKYHSHDLREITFIIRNQAAAAKWGARAQKVKDRQLLSFCRLCVSPQRRENLLDFIHALNCVRFSPDSGLSAQIPSVRARIGSLTNFPSN